MIQKIFSIYNNTGKACRFYTEVGEDHIACWCVDENNALRTFEFFNFPYMEDGFAETFRQVKLNSALLGGEYESSYVIWENEHCICIPNNFFSSSASEKYLTNVLGNTLHSTNMHYALDEAVLAYKVQNDHFKVVNENLPGAKQLHKYCALVRSVKNTAEANNNFIKTIFYQNHFVLMAVENEQLKLIRRFNYKTSDDVIYHVLNTTAQLNMNIEETDVIVSGLIDLQSVLYRELYKYIHHLKVDSIADASLDDTEYPAHYLIPFYKYAV